jgi:hypothetical protein
VEKRRNALGFYQIGKANGIPIYVSTERADASESEKRLIEAKLNLATYQILLSALSSDSALRSKFNDNGKSDTCFWIADTGRNANHLITDSQEAEITDSQEVEIFKLAESGMKYTDIARKLGIPVVGVFYALKRRPKNRKKCQKDPELRFYVLLIRNEILSWAKEILSRLLFVYRKVRMIIRFCSSCFVTVTLGSVARVSYSLRAAGGSLHLILSLEW